MVLGAAFLISFLIIAFSDPIGLRSYSNMQLEYLVFVLNNTPSKSSFHCFIFFMNVN